MSKDSQNSPSRNKVMLPLLVGSIVVVTLGIAFACVHLFNGVDENIDKLRSYKVREETSKDPLIDLEPFVDKQGNNAKYHPECEALYQKGEKKQRQKKYKEAIRFFEQSRQQYLKDVGSRPLDGADRLHIAVRYHNISDCYVGLGNLEAALKNINQACELFPTDWTHFKCRIKIYELMGKKDLADADRKRMAPSPGMQPLNFLPPG